MNKNGLYHKDIFLPKIKFPNVDIVLSYTYHSIEASKSDRYGRICLPQTINLNDAEIIEAEIIDNKIYKIVVRVKYNYQYDLVLVILNSGMKVKTVWLNDKSDNHKTLNRSKYNTKG